MVKKTKIARKPSNPGGKDAFEQWLHRGLSNLFSDAVGEPLPEHLLRLIEEKGDDEEQGLVDQSTKPTRLKN